MKKNIQPINNIIKEPFIIVVDHQQIIKLMQVGPWVLEQQDLLKKITQWRQKHMHMFLSWFQATVEQTQSYIEQTFFNNHHRFLFLIIGQNNQLLGHCGIIIHEDQQIIEFDNIVKDDTCHIKGLISITIQKLMDWCAQIFQIQKFMVHVLSYNQKAIHCYQKIGFVTEKTFYLQKEETNQKTIHHLSQKRGNVDYQYIKMSLIRE